MGNRRHQDSIRKYARTGPHFTARQIPSEMPGQFAVGDRVLIIATQEECVVEKVHSYGYVLSGHTGKYFPTKAIRAVSQ